MKSPKKYETKDYFMKRSYIHRVCLIAVIGLLAYSAVYGQVIQNPSFESNSFSVYPGYISANGEITGWVGQPADRVGINPANGMPFADNGTIPNGAKVAFIQSFTGGSASLSTTITGLTNGMKYTVNFRFNARKGSAVTTTVLKIKVDDQLITSLSTTFVDGTNPYRYGAFDFTANSETATLTLINDVNGDSTVLVDNFSINVSTSAWSYVAWTDDSTSGVDSSKNYTHAYNFGGAQADATINGVTFKSINGANPTVAGEFRAGLGNVWTGSFDNNITGNGAALSKQFVYGGNPGVFTIANLIPGKEYVATFYSVGWEDGVRSQTFSYGNDRMTINEDHYGNKNGIRIMYHYIAPQSGAIQLIQTPTLPANTLHLFGFANYEVEPTTTPVIGVQPSNHVVIPGSTASFRITASGARPLSYQWYKGDTLLDGQTSRYLTVSNITENDLGPYYITVLNSYGVVTSAVATLTFGQIANPGFEANIFDIYPGYINGNQPISGWYASDPSRAGINPLSDGQAPFANNGTPEGRQSLFLQSVANAPKSVWTYITGLTPGENYFINFDVNCRDYNGTQPTFRVAVDNQMIGEGRSRPVGGTNRYRTVAFPFVPANDTVMLSITNDFNNDSAILLDNFRVEKRNTSWSYEIWTNDLTSGVDGGRGCSHAVNLGGAGLAADTTINQIRFRGVPGLNPYVNNYFYLTNYTTTYNTPDSNILTTNGGGSGLLAQSFIYYGGAVPDGIAPTITLTNLIPGIEYELTIFGVGWEAKSTTRSSTFVCGNDKLTINEDAFNSDNGIRVKYRYVADDSGSITVSYWQVNNNDSFHTYGFINQELNSTLPPSFYRQPLGRTIAGGSTLVLDGLVGGQAPFSFQWQKDGVDLLNQTNLILVLENVNGSHTGGYTLIVSNTVGVVTSQVALVEVGLALVNASFESDNFTNYPGYVSGNFPITGWTASVIDRIGINPASGAPFANNGTIPEGSKVAFIQGDGAVLSQVITGMEIGKTYYVKFYENSRSEFPAPNLIVTLGGEVVVGSHTVNSGEYKVVVSNPILAVSESAELAFIKQPGPLGGDSTVLIDNVVVLELPPTPPTFLSQSTSYYVKQGETINLIPIVQGTLPINYQWQLNGVNIPGANDSSLNIPGILLNQSGVYTLVASNQLGATTNQVAIIDVGLGFTELFNTGVDDSGALAQGGTADLHYQLIISHDPVGRGPEAYILYDDWPATNGAYMTNGPSSKWLAPTRIDPVAKNGHADGLYVYRTIFFLDITDPSTAVLRGKWAIDNNGLDIVLNGVSTGISNYNGFGIFTEFTITNGFVAGTNVLDFYTTNIVTTGANPNALRVELYGVAKPLVDKQPQLVGMPANAIVNELQDTNFTVLAIGSPPLYYQWYYEGFELTGETNRHIKLSRVSADQAGSYFVVVSNDFGAVTSSVAMLSVITPPLIELDPIETYVGRGETATFEVIASSTVPLAYQWYWNNQLLAGETNSTLVIENVTPAHRGEYFVVVANSAGSVTSAVALLGVPNSPPQAIAYGINIVPDTTGIIKIADLLSAIVDADGDAVSFVNVSIASAIGSIATNDTEIVYTPQSGFTGVDSFTYTVTDGYDNSIGTLEINVVAGVVPPKNNIGIQKSGVGFNLRFNGVSGKTYKLQRAENIEGPWVTVSTQIAPSYGLIDFEDNTPLPNRAFYRVFEFEPTIIY